jgi:hypothetical protein
MDIVGRHETYETPKKISGPREVIPWDVTVRRGVHVQTPRYTKIRHIPRVREDRLGFGR